ncbi:MAG: hypothetical protein ABGX23_00420 [Nautiliaceae bacterium]
MNTKLSIKASNLLYSLHTQNQQTITLFKEELKSLLESSIPVYEKTDLVADMIMDIDEKINYIKSKIMLLNSIKKQLETDKQIAKEVIAKTFKEYGIDKLEGMQISSITITPEKEEIKEHIKIKDEKALIELGYAKVDEKKLKEALYTDKYNEIEPFIDVEVEAVKKPSSIRINKRKVHIPAIENEKSA